MIKHVIKFEYLTADNNTVKNHTTIIEFTEIKSIDSTVVFTAVKSKLQEMHNLLIQKFPTMGFAMPRLKKIIDIKIIN